MARRDYTSIPIPIANVHSLTESVSAVKQTIDVLVGNTRNKNATAVTWDDLVALGLITADQIPTS